jgi:hypothetical protein
MRTILILTLACTLAGCASHASTNYARVDGAPTNPAHAQAVLAQCKGEGVQSVGQGVYLGGPISRASKEATVTDACMARNGYLTQ